MRSSKKFLAAVVGAAVALALVASPALAQNPHFVSAKTDVSGFPDAAVTFKAVGLGNIAGETVVVQLFGDVTASYQCMTSNGGCPAAANKKSSGHDLLAAGEFTVSGNGQVTGSLIVDESKIPDPDNDCPPGQTQTLMSVAYENFELQLLYNDEVVASIQIADAVKVLARCKAKGKKN